MKEVRDMKSLKASLKTNLCKITKSTVEKVIINSANTTSSILAHQPVAPKEIEMFKNVKR